jgi:hypothetical protein
LESWWHSAHQKWARTSSQKNITVICPHPAAVFNEETTSHAKAQLAAVHSVMLEARRHYCQQQQYHPQLQQQLQDLFDESWLQNQK